MCGILAGAGVKQASRISTAESRTTMTRYDCINAIGNALPPAYAFLRVHIKDYMLKGIPSQSLGFAYPSGWMSSDIFPEILNHFI